MPNEANKPGASGLTAKGVPGQSTISGYVPRGRPGESRTETARKVTMWLLIMFPVLMLIHYTCVMVLVMYNRDYGVKTMDDSFHAWLPVLSGFVGSAVTYYLTKSEK